MDYRKRAIFPAEVPWTGGISDFHEDLPSPCWRNQAHAIEMRLNPNCSVLSAQGRKMLEPLLRVKMAGAKLELPRSWYLCWEMEYLSTPSVGHQHWTEILLCISYVTCSTWSCIREQRLKEQFMRTCKFIDDPNCKFINDSKIWSCPLVFPVSWKQGWW